MRLLVLGLLALGVLGCDSGDGASPAPVAWQWVEEGRLIASPAPERAAGGSEGWWRSLDQAAGDRPLAVLNLRETPDPEPPAGLSVDSLQAPIPDFGVPSAEVTSRALQFIASRLAAGKVVVVHCGAGCGRTGTILALHLKHSQGIPADEAIRRVREARRCAVETPEQEAFVREN